MSDDGSGPHVRQSPRTRSEELRVADLTMMVRVPGQPAALRVYTDDSKSEAARYASEAGGEVVPLPLPPPTSYTAGLSGSLIRHALSERTGRRSEIGPRSGCAVIATTGIERGVLGAQRRHVMSAP